MITKKDITELSYKILGCAIKVHKELGPGLLESVYEKCLAHELKSNGFEIITQKNVPIKYGQIEIEAQLRCDIIVNNLIVVEVKAVEAVNPVYEAQLLSYMKLLGLPQGLLINFFTNNIVKSSKPLVNEFFKKFPDK
jgi:GxxExxY protein